MQTTQIQAAKLIPGMLVVRGSQTVKVVGLPQACKARNYIRVPTTGEAVNCHREDMITIAK